MPRGSGMTTPGFRKGAGRFFIYPPTVASPPSPGHVTVGTADNHRTAGRESAASRTGLFAHPGVGKPCDLRPLCRSIKNGRSRKRPRPPPKSNQSVAAAAPRQVNRPSGKSFSQRVCTPTPGNTRPSPVPKRSASRYRAPPRKVLRKANEAGATRNRTDR